MAKDGRQLVRFLFLRLDPAWRRLPADEQRAHKLEFGRAVHEFRAELLLRSYSLAGTRGDADLLLWQAADSLEALQALQTAIFSTRLGGYLAIAHSYLATTRRSSYVFPPRDGEEPRLAVQPQDARYLFVYPFTKTRDWYALPHERRQELMAEHVQIGRRYAVRANTTYSFGLDDQEFVVAFEGDEPADFVDLVMELRESRASAYTRSDTPVFTCIHMSLWDALDTLGGAPAASRAAAHAAGNGDAFVPVATTPEIPDGRAKRVYLGGDAVALFNVAGRFYAVHDRCPHGRASLSEGMVDASACALTCPWHQGTFDLRSGEPTSGPPRAPLRTYRVKVDGERILIA